MTISASKVACYLSCQKKYWFLYNQELVPAVEHEALSIGKKYHNNVANHLSGELSEHDYLSKAFMKHIDTSDWKILEVEKEFRIPLSHGIHLHGFVDGIVEVNGKKHLVEHKTTSGSIDEAYVDSLMWDNQIPLYCEATGIYDVLYTVVRKPKLKQYKVGKTRLVAETDEEFDARRLKWYEDDTETKIRVFSFRRVKSEVAETRRELVELAKEMRARKTFHRNKGACTGYFTCPYRSICLNYNPQITVGFKKRERN